MAGPFVELTTSELVLATEVGGKRQLRALLAGRPNAHGFNGDGWEAHVMGAIGECVVAKYLGCYWSGAGLLLATDDDVRGVQVRYRSSEAYDLLVWRSDDPGRIYVLVTGGPSRFTIHGWVYGWEAKQDRYLQQVTARPASYFVPQADLHPIDAWPRTVVPQAPAQDALRPPS